MQGYADVGETARALNTIKVGADYITSCSISSEEFVVQVGNYADDLADLHSPEDMTQARPVYIVNSTYPGKTCCTSIVLCQYNTVFFLFFSVPSHYWPQFSPPACSALLTLPHALP